MRQNIPAIRLQPDVGGDRLMARDGVVLCFFLRHSHKEVAPAIWRALEYTVAPSPPQALAWYSSDEGEPTPLDEKGWAYIRYQILERSGGLAWVVELEEDCSQVGGYHFEYWGRRLDDPEGFHNENATTGVLFTLPTEYLVEHGPGHVRALALELARELPFSFGYASLAIVAPHGLWFSARRSVAPLLSRYLGLDIITEPDHPDHWHPRPRRLLADVPGPAAARAAGGPGGAAREAAVAAGVLRAPGA